jgi:hypothetical protein
VLLTIGPILRTSAENTGQLLGSARKLKHLPYITPTKNLKIKLPNEIVFNMTIFSQGNTEEYLAQVNAVVYLINQKGT